MMRKLGKSFMWFLARALIMGCLTFSFTFISAMHTIDNSGLQDNIQPTAYTSYKN